MSRKDADQLVSDLRRFFAATGSRFSVERRGGHWHVVNENGSSVAAFGSTPSDHRFRANTITQLRRRGVVPPDWRG